MKSKLLFFFVFLFLLLSLLSSVSASSFYIPQNTNYSLKFNCEIDEAICSDSATCNISIEYPNSTSLIDNDDATFIANGRYNYSLTDSQNSVLGEDYVLSIACFDGTVNGTQTVNYGINPSGIRPSEQRTNTITRSIYFVFVIGILLFVAFLFVKQSAPVKWTFFAVSIIFFLIGINTIFISLQDEIVNPQLENFFSAFTAISWYFYWFVAGLLIIMWIFTFINTWILKKNLSNLQKYGGEK